MLKVIYVENLIADMQNIFEGISTMGLMKQTPKHCFWVEFFFN
jgi:hypothetical protein